MPRVGLTRQGVIAAAAEYADEHGLGGLTLSGLAKELGVRQPSLYKHVESLAALHAGVGLLAGRELAAVLTEAAAKRTGSTALRDVATAYWDFAHKHPGRYAALNEAMGYEPVDTPSGGGERGDAHRAVTDEAITLIATTLGNTTEAGHGERIHAARAIRALLHGFITLQAGGGFNLDVDARTSMLWALDSLARGMTQHPK